MLADHATLPLDELTDRLLWAARRACTAHDYVQLSDMLPLRACRRCGRVADHQPKEMR